MIINSKINFNDVENFSKQGRMGDSLIANYPLYLLSQLVQ